MQLVLSPNQHEIDSRIRVIQSGIGKVLQARSEVPMSGTPADADVLAELDRGAEYARRADASLH